MAKLSAEQIATLAYSAGIHDPQNLSIAVAIAFAESGGDPTKHNTKGLDDSYGLWQINMKGAKGPDRRAKLSIASDAALLDPATNARAMVMISGTGKKWTDWTVWNTGRWVQFLAPARAAAATVTAGKTAPADEGGGLLDILDDTLSLPADIAEAIEAIAVRVAAAGSWLGDRHNWIRILYVAGGGALMVAALVAAGQKPVLDAAGKVVQLVIPAGKAAGAAKKAGSAAGAVG